MIELRGDISKRLTTNVLESIRKAPKPTKVAEVLAVAKELGGVAVSLDEVAEIINISDPGRDEKARANDYSVRDLDKHPDLLLVKTPRETLIRYVGARSIYGRGREE